VYQQLERPEDLFEHIFGDSVGFLVTFTGQQARFSRRDARPNELADIRQRSFRYPDEAEQAADYLLSEAAGERDAYVGVHLFREAGNRRASNAVKWVSALWLDEDEGRFPEGGPEPTAGVRSSADRRHLYWRLTEPISIEWAIRMNRRLAALAGGDIGKAGPATVLRAPGTANYKRHPQIDPVTLALTESGPWEPEVMEQAVPELPDPGTPVFPRGPRGPYDGPEVGLEDYLRNPDLGVFGELRDELGRKFSILCPWWREHSGKDRTGTRMGRRTNGGFWFHCDHDHCRGRGWPEFREVIRPAFYIQLHRPKDSSNSTKIVRLARG
jgi:RepB DNA-primase from phage plasmid